MLFFLISWTCAVLAHRFADLGKGPMTLGPKLGLIPWFPCELALTMLGRNDGGVGVDNLTTLGVRLCGVLALLPFLFNELDPACVLFWFLC